MLTDLQNRGVEDILIACIDGLKGFPETIQSVNPNTSVQLCVVHQIRNSIKYVGYRNQKEFRKDFICVYQAVNKESEGNKLLKLEEKWGEQYSIFIMSCRTIGISYPNTSDTLRFSSESDSIYTLFHKISHFTLFPYSYIRSLK